MEFNETEDADRRSSVEVGDNSGGRDRVVTETAGDRHGGPNFARGEDDPQSHDDSSQHSSSESGSHSISQEAGSRVPGESGCQGDDGSEAGVEAELDDDKDLGTKAAMDLMKRMDEGAEVSEEEFRNVMRMRRNPQSSREKTPFKIKSGGRLEELDNYYTNNPMSIPHTRYFDKSILEWSDLDYLLSLPDAYEIQEQVSSYPTSSRITSDPSTSTVSASPTQFSPFTRRPLSTGSLSAPPSPTFPGQPTSADRPQPSTSTVPPGIGLCYMYASKASRFKNINASKDTTIVSSILSNLNSQGGAYGQAEAKETSPRKQFKGHVAKLHAEEGLKGEEKIKTKEEWDEIASQMKEKRMYRKSFQEVLVDLETLLQLYQLSRLMTRYFTVPPRSILETFDMAYRIKKLGRPSNSRELTREDESKLAQQLSEELLGIIPTYDDFPVPYMAGIEVPEKWFYLRFKCIGGFDRLRCCTKGAYHSWVTPTRYSDRKKLRFCYVRPEIIAHDYPYDRTRLLSRKHPTVLELLAECAGPPFKPLLVKQAFAHMNPAVLRNYMIRFESYIPKIKETQLQQRKRMERHFNDRFDVTKNGFELFETNYELARASYNRRCSGRVLRDWNEYFYEQTVKVFSCLQRIVDVAQIGMRLSIKNSDNWSFKIEDMEEMLKHKIPLFDLGIVDERPLQE